MVIGPGRPAFINRKCISGGNPSLSIFNISSVVSAGGECKPASLFARTLSSCSRSTLARLSVASLAFCCDDSDESITNVR